LVAQLSRERCDAPLQDPAQLSERHPVVGVAVLFQIGQETAQIGEGADWGSECHGGVDCSRCDTAQGGGPAFNHTPTFPGLGMENTGASTANSAVFWQEDL
jgi:hypothetical protein